MKGVSVSVADYEIPTVREFITEPLGDVPNAEAQLKPIAERLNIVDLLDRPLYKPTEDLSLGEQLSGGQKVLVAMARSLITQPEVWVIDDGFSDRLDEKLNYRMIELIFDIRTEVNPDLITLVATRTPTLVQHLVSAGKVAVLDRGKLLQLGTPSELYSKPKSPDVLRSIAHWPLNEVEGVMETEVGRAVFKSSLQDIALPETISDSLAELRPATLVIPAEAAQMRRSEADIAVGGKVVSVNEISGEIVLLSNDKLFHAQGSFPGFQPGQEHTVYYDINSVHIFGK